MIDLQFRLRLIIHVIWLGFYRILWSLYSRDRRAEKEFERRHQGWSSRSKCHLSG